MMTQHDDTGGGWVGLVGLVGQVDLVGLVGLITTGPLNDDPTLVSQPAFFKWGTLLAITGPLNDDPT